MRGMAEVLDRACSVGGRHGGDGVRRVVPKTPPPPPQLYRPRGIRSRPFHRNRNGKGALETEKPSLLESRKLGMVKRQERDEIAFNR